MGMPAGPQLPPAAGAAPAPPQHGMLADALAGVKRALGGAAVGPMGAPGSEQEAKRPKHFRTAAGQKWIDPTLDEWPESALPDLPVYLSLAFHVSEA